MLMDERKLRILNAIIDDYITTALPVGSRTITKKYEMGVSPATIRNEMSDLEELGYLAQPHVSAGRVPSPKAYRLYVDMLLKSGRAGAVHDEQVCAYLAEHVRQMDDMIESAAQAISELTHYTSLVMMPGQLELRIATLQLVPMRRGAALLVIVTDSGIVRDTVIHVSNHLDADALYAISRMLTERLAGKTLSEVQAMLSMFATTGAANHKVLEGVQELAAQMEKQAAVDSIAVGGAHNILNYPEYADVDRARAFLTLMENKDTLLTLLKRGQEDINVHIGVETGLAQMEHLSVVTAHYTIGGKHRGTVGIIGPTRMPYDKMINILATVGSMLTELYSPEELTNGGRHEEV